MDDVIRVSFLVLVGLALAIGVTWYVGFLYQEIRGNGQIVIDRFTVVQAEGKGNEELGDALAQMLQVRLQSLVRELRDAQAGLTSPADISESAELQSATLIRNIRNVRFWNQPLSLQTALLQPAELKLSVAGLDVGGIVPWVQRGLTSRRTLHFTIYMQSDEVQIYGSVGALGLSRRGLRLSVKGAGGKAPTLGTVVDNLAHEILHLQLAQDKENKLELLNSVEFRDLSEVLVGAAQANRTALLGRATPDEFSTLLPRIEALSEQVPNWLELNYLAAWIADSAKDSQKALSYYQQVLRNPKSATRSELRKSINARIAALTPEFSTSDSLPNSLDYSKEIKFVRDSGPEGSVVGLALATALEFQIAKATGEDRRISARYIYYAARKIEGWLKFDSGAHIRDGIAALRKDGAVEEEVWPYRAGEFGRAPPRSVAKAKRFRIAAAKKVNNLNDVKRALKANGPIVAGIAVFESMMSTSAAKTGYVHLPKQKESTLGGHAIVIVGYDDTTRYVKFVNSWGTGWGEHGFGYLPYDYIERYMDDAWTFKLATK